MEVTRTNFQEVLAELDDILDNATFLSIDGEFTGLNSGPDASAFDTPAQYYAKLRSGSMDFLLVQFGLSVFTYNDKTNKYTERSYNFYVFPRPIDRTGPDCRFMCQTASINFLANQGFDFNKLFKHGIPYLTTSEEERLTKRLEERQKAREEVLESIPISDYDKPQIEEICSRIEEFIASDAEELTIDRCNAFIRRLVHQEARLRWPNKLRLESRSDNKHHYILVQRTGTKEEEEQKEAERKEREKMEIKQAVGMSTLLRKIANSGKLIVGHNMLLDLCHVIHKFFAPLPENYQEFKSLVNLLFPRILDTKLICQSQQFKESVSSSNLTVLLETVSKAPFSHPELESVKDRSYSTMEEKSHEAGYDAYITGVCFIALSNYLGSLQKPEISTVLPDSPLLNPFLNKLLISRLKDFPYISLAGKDPNPSRAHVFHITFPKEWKYSDITQLFNPFGGVHISWLSDTSAYVGLNRRDQASAVAKTLVESSVYKIQKYSEHQATLEPNLHSRERKRKLSSSENSSAKEEETATNSAKATRDDEGWELVTGNDLKLSSITPPSYPRERSRAGPRTRGANHEVLEQIKVAQRVRLKNSLGLPTDFRNGEKVGVPKYAMPRCNTESELKYVAELTECHLDAEERTSAKDTREAEDRGLSCPATVDNGVKRQASTRVTKSSSNEQSSKSPAWNVTKQKQVEPRSSPSAAGKSRRNSCLGSSPSASPRTKRSPKKSSRSMDLVPDKQDKLEVSPRSSTLVDQERNLWNSGLKGMEERMAKEEQMKRRILSESKEKLELKKPSLKLLRSGKKRSEGVFSMAGLIVRVAKLAGVLLFLYVVMVF
ncbi:hypothetical protein KM043_011217 [Ampulex compressa]|nr:hypothetical protein KM043_011217 [Ampulex compressa]